MLIFSIYFIWVLLSLFANFFHQSCVWHLFFFFLNTQLIIIQQIKSVFISPPNPAEGKYILHNEIASLWSLRNSRFTPMAKIQVTNLVYQSGPVVMTSLMNYIRKNHITCRLECRLGRFLGTPNSSRRWWRRHDGIQILVDDGQMNRRALTVDCVRHPPLDSSKRYYAMMRNLDIGGK